MADEKQTSEMETQAVLARCRGKLRDKRVRPEGVVPKQAQGYVVAGLAVLILLAVMFSKNHAKPAAERIAIIADGGVHRHEPAQDSGAWSRT